MIIKGSFNSTITTSN